MDACDRIETVPVSIWNDEHPRKPVPPWLLRLVHDISKSFAVEPPHVRVMQVRCPSTFGGRWFDRVCSNKRCYTHAIGVILHPKKSITYAVTCHEMAHYISKLRNGDRKGHHDDRFFDIVETVYARFGVSVTTARTVESTRPESWETARSWGQVLRKRTRGR